jgi:Na+/glutamate symporter
MNLFFRKIIMNGIVVVPLLIWLSDASFWGSVFAAVILSVVAYYVGDQMILRLSNNTIAVIADVGLAFFYLWAVTSIMNWALTLGEIFIISIALGLVEIIFHRQLGRVDNNRRGIA